MGPKRITALEKEAEEWRMKAEDAAASIQDITVNYFAQTSKALAGIRCCCFYLSDLYVSLLTLGLHKMENIIAGSIWTLCSCAGMVKQMEEDKLRFGPAAWASAAPRLEKLRFLLAKETLQHMRATEMCLSRRKETIKDRVRHTAVLIVL